MNPAKELRHIAKMVTASDITGQLIVFSKPGYSLVFIEFDKFVDSPVEMSVLPPVQQKLVGLIDKCRKVSKSNALSIHNSATNADGQPYVHIQDGNLYAGARLALVSGRPLSKTAALNLAKEFSAASGIKVVAEWDKHDF